MSIKIKGSISVGYSNSSRKFEFDTSDFGLTDTDWLALPVAERQEILDEALDTEIGNVLDASIWVEGED